MFQFPISLLLTSAIKKSFKIHESKDFKKFLLSLNQSLYYN